MLNRRRLRSSAGPRLAVVPEPPEPADPEPGTHGLDQWDAVSAWPGPFAMSAERRSAARRQVRQQVEALIGAIDEGTPAALDPEIESWVAGWIRRVDSEYATRHSDLINALVQAKQRRDYLRQRAQTQQTALAEARADFDAARARLTAEDEPDPAPFAGITQAAGEDS